MIYAGIIHFSSSPDRVHQISSILSSYTEKSPAIIKKNALTLFYGKLSELQDKDDIWENDSSLLIGRIFDNNNTAFEKKAFKNISSLSKEEFLAKFWGKYICIVSMLETNSFNIIIDPTGQLPFFYYVFPDGDVLFSSNIEIIFKILEKKPTYNWEYLYAYLIYGNSCTVQSPFKDVYELPAACYLHISKKDKITKSFWNPLSSYTSAAYQDKDAVDILQVTLKSWIEPYESICVSLSGGLDSSCLVYCLQELIQINQNLTALNYFHSQMKASNELDYARKVCGEVGINLIEMDASEYLPCEPVSYNQSLLPNKPSPGLLSMKWLENILAYLPLDRSCTFISGHGSDHVFMRPPAKKSLSDYIIEKGLRGSKQTLEAITAFYRDSVFSTLKENILDLGFYFIGHRTHKRHAKNLQEKPAYWLREDALKNVSDAFVHPIYSGLSLRIPPGKYTQIDLFYEALASLHMEINPILPTYYPYLYEPVVNFALSFPTYDLFDKGYDRYPLRKSVGERFKTETVWRRDKGQTTGIFQLGVKKNLEYVLNTCLEGQFSKQGFIDKKELEESIKRISNGDINYMSHFSHLASAEIFLQYWNNKFQ